MPDRIGDSDMYNLLADEYFVANDGTKVVGPQAGLRIKDFVGLGLLSVQTSDRILEINGDVITDFEKVVQKIS